MTRDVQSTLHDPLTSDEIMYRHELDDQAKGVPSSDRCFGSHTNRFYLIRSPGKTPRVMNVTTHIRLNAEVQTARIYTFASP